MHRPPACCGKTWSLLQGGAHLLPRPGTWRGEPTLTMKRVQRFLFSLLYDRVSDSGRAFVIALAAVRMELLSERVVQPIDARAQEKDEMAREVGANEKC